MKTGASGARHVYLATDPDREGEAISWHIAQMLGVDPKAVSRIEFNEITKNAVTNAISHPRQLNLDLVDAQQARRVLDRLVGYKAVAIAVAQGEERPLRGTRAVGGGAHHLRP